jgi:hypothetical protein
MNSRLVVLVASVLFLAGAPALAQTPPTPTPTASPTPTALPTLPAGVDTVVEGIVQKIAGDATAGFGIDPNHVRGTVTFFKRFDLQIHMPLDRYRDIHLHQGTIINPRGATLTTGQVVDVQGHANADGSIDANAITIVQ